MRLTQQTSHSIRTLVHCAQHSAGPSRVHDIAATYGMSELHLFKIMKDLVNSGFVATLRGRNGGIRLARPAHEITVGEVVRAVEPSFALSECLDGDHECPVNGHCGFGKVLKEALGAFLAVLDTYTIADIARDGSGLSQVLGIEALHPLYGVALPTRED